MTDIQERLNTLAKTGYWAHLGIEAVSTADGLGVARMVVAEEHLNYNGFSHGGVMPGLADCAAGLAIQSVRTADEIAANPHVTTDMHVSYLGAARAGSSLTATARILRQGRTAVFLTVEVADESGRTMAHASLTFVITTRRT